MILVDEQHLDIMLPKNEILAQTLTLNVLKNIMHETQSLNAVQSEN